VTEILAAYLNGEITGEVFMDTAFAAAHNNGTVFNKPFVYSGASDLQLVLDVQRAGQMPAFVNDVLERGIQYKTIPPQVKDMWERLKYLLPDSDIWNPVDWDTVALSSEQGHSWSHCKSKQTQVLGETSTGYLKGAKAYGPMSHLNKTVKVGEANRKVKA
jgi:hypothetical protein